MPKPQLLYSTEDELGNIHVEDDGVYRTLSFAAHHEQSRCLKSAPHIPQHEYTQAMLLVLLFIKPKRVLLLGLGGGSLASALLHYLDDVQITAVELRKSVIDLAFRYFYLPEDSRFKVLHNDAIRYLAETDAPPFDVIFGDLYHAEDVDEAQLQAEFMVRCARQLDEEGWLVLNGWNQHRENREFISALKESFSQVRTVLVDGRNWVMFASNRVDIPSNNVLNQSAVQVSRELGCPLVRYQVKMKVLGA